jgi:hypothetical protein
MTVSTKTRAPRKPRTQAVAAGKDVVAPGNDSPAVAKGNDPAPTPPKAPAPAPAPCACSCGADANVGKAYRPGHDARHAGQVGRLLVAKAPAAQAEFAKLPPALRAKAERFAANRLAAEMKKATARELRAKAAAALKAELAAL